jgi:hypothetical protein
MADRSDEPKSKAATKSSEHVGVLVVVRAACPTGSQQSQHTQSRNDT